MRTRSLISELKEDLPADLNMRMISDPKENLHSDSKKKDSTDLTDLTGLTETDSTDQTGKMISDRTADQISDPKESL